MFKPHPPGYLRIYPRTFAEGTKSKPYGTLTVDDAELSAVACSPSPEGPYPIDMHDAARSPETCPWRYLIDRPQVPGPVHVAFRGKSLAFTAGEVRNIWLQITHSLTSVSQHILVIHFGLEGNLRLVPNADLFEITSVSQPGPNRNAAKAQRLRTFPLPDRFVTPHSQDKGRAVNILAAVIMEEISIIVCDFCRITRLHVISSTRIFDAPDLLVGSKVDFALLSNTT